MKTSKPFIAALHRARAEFVLARRDDLYHLSNRALETLLAVLDNPKASPAVQLRAAMFILQRPQLPKTGWSMPEPAPDPDGRNSSTRPSSNRTTIACRASVTSKGRPRRRPPKKNPPPNQPLPNPTAPGIARPPPDDRSPCNQMQHDFEICDDVASAPAPRRPLHSCPVPPAVLKARNDHRKYLELLDMIKSIEQTPIPRIEKEGSPAGAEADAEANEEEILV
jgi:hypothetical protein